MIQVAQSAVAAPAAAAIPAPNLASPPSPGRTSAFAATTAPEQAPDAEAEAARRDALERYVQSLAQQHGFDADNLRALLTRTQTDTTALRLINPALAPAYRKVWTDYRARFVEPVRIARGLEFRSRNARTLARAEVAEGVPASIIIAIIGVETVFGRNTGNHRVLDALSTLAFDYQPRADYFRGELTQYLLYARENHLDPGTLRGSYAGAIGIPQFMPTSIRQYAQDFDGDGVIDLEHSEADAIGSVARFLRLHGWVPGLTTHYRALVQDAARARPALERGPQPRDTIATLRQLGVDSPDPVAADEPLVLAELVNGEAPADYVLGTRNFYAITRYNRSYFYAMAVIDLAQAIERTRTARKEHNSAGSTVPVRVTASARRSSRND